MSFFNLEVEAGAWLSETGVETTLYIGPYTDTPAVQVHQTYKELIDQKLTVYTVMGDKIIPQHYDEVAELLQALKSTYEYAEKRAKEMGWEVET